MIGILSSDIEKFWGDISCAILKGNGKADFLRWYPLDHIKQRLQRAEWQCWHDGKTFFLTCITIFPSGYKEFEILLVCGKNIDQWNVKAWGILKAFANHHKCDEIKFMGRKGWQRYGKAIEPDLLTVNHYRVKLCQVAA